jgi:hypothetical protein
MAYQISRLLGASLQPTSVDRESSCEVITSIAIYALAHVDIVKI